MGAPKAFFYGGGAKKRLCFSRKYAIFLCGAVAFSDGRSGQNRSPADRFSIKAGLQL
jgi:hypothetical protein